MIQFSHMWLILEDKERKGGLQVIQIAICDDEIGTCSEIENMVIQYGNSHALQIETEVFYSGETLFDFFQKEYLFDLIFLDIQLFQLDGVQVGKLIREQLKNEKVSIVYISSKETYAMSLFQVRPLDFIIKPITQDKIFSVLKKFVMLNEINKNEFYFGIGKSIFKLYLDEIRYFACSAKKIEIYADSGVKEFYGNMQEVWKQVNGKGFWTIHKSYIVNVSFISSYHYDSVQMMDGTILPISQKYRKTIKKHLTEQYRKE